MKAPFRSSSKPARFFGIALSLAMSLFSYGALIMPAASAVAAESPTVAQQPLTLQPPIPPNIVLMFDDSGSMAWNFMPDWTSLQNNTDNDAVIDASNNGVYYNPTATYTPPPYANGTFYPSQTDMSNVPEDGFGVNTTAKVNLFTYDGSYDYKSNGTGGVSNGSAIDYNVAVPGTTAATYSAIAASGSDCQAVFDSTPNTISGTLVFNNGTNTDGSGNCTFQYYPTNHYFQYSTGPVGGPYVVHYVASAKQGCGGLDATTTPTCVLDTDVGDGTNGAPAPGTNGAPAGGVTVGQNIANWFAYYHTRILMAKSGLMTAFSTLDPKFRVGFGSINNKNVSGLPAPTYSSSHTIADVAVFGGPTDTASQRINFWNWVAGESAGGSTPLRTALATVGSYYQTTQPWTNMASDPQFSNTNPYDASSPGSPLQCRQAYTILTTDGFWNGSYSSSATLHASDTAGPTFTPPLGSTYTGYTPADPFQGGDATDGNGNATPSLADVAMYYWKTDLQPDSSPGADDGLADEVPPSDEDPAYWQHMVTFTMGLGFAPKNITGTGPAPNSNNPPTTQDIFKWANDGGGPASKYAIENFSWPQPSPDSSNNIADLEHAGVNGHGGFFLANNPQAFASGLETALKRTEESTRTGASLAANSTQLNTGTVIYQANYFPGYDFLKADNRLTAKWKGDLKALSVNSVTGEINPDPTWTASSMLTASATVTGGVSTYPDRKITTYNPDTGTFTEFKNGTGTPPSLSTVQLTALGSDATAQEAMVDYLRGDASSEQQNGGTFRSRGTPLGDIVDSQPVYSGPPDPNEFINQTFFGTTVDSNTKTVPFYDWAVGTTSAGVFTASKASKRTPLVYVAANDGMLHAFNAGTGTEVFAYLPGAVITAGLANLSDPDYGSAADPHQFYNDGQLTIADAYLKLPSDTSPQWHTILVGTTGRGLAKTVYALDVTDPGSITPLWERSAGDGKSGSDYIGQVVGKPVIAQTNYVPATTSTAASSTWSVLIGNGYNSTKGVAALLQFNLADGTLNVHPTTDTSGGNGLAAPVAWMDNPVNGVSDVAYAGDLHGQVWKFPLNDTTGSAPTPTSTGSLLFTAKDAGGKVQPITAGMLAGKDPHTSNVWLFFGTGQYLSSADLTNRDTQTWYGIIVQSATSKLVTNLANGRSALVQRTITAQTAGGSGGSPPLPARSVSTQTLDSKTGTTDMTDKSGWYLDLLKPGSSGSIQQGERMVDPNQFQGSLLIGVTRIPLVTDVCNPSGSGWIMALDPFTGTAPGDDFFDVNNDGYINAGDRVNGGHAAGVGFSSLPNAPIFVGGIMETSFDNGTTSSLKTAGTVGTVKRVTWRELVNP